MAADITPPPPPPGKAGSQEPSADPRRRWREANLKTVIDTFGDAEKRLVANALDIPATGSHAGMEQSSAWLDDGSRYAREPMPASGFLWTLPDGGELLIPAGGDGYATRYPGEGWVWHLAASAGAVSVNHADAGGLCTEVNLKTGAKLWAVRLTDDTPDPENGGYDDVRGGSNGKPRYRWYIIDLAAGDSL